MPLGTRSDCEQVQILFVTNRPSMQMQRQRQYLFFARDAWSVYQHTYWASTLVSSVHGTTLNSPQEASDESRVQSMASLGLC